MAVLELPEIPGQLEVPPAVLTHFALLPRSYVAMRTKVGPEALLRISPPVAKNVEIVLERGKKKAVVFAPAWPGWSRGASTVDGALEKLAVYADRYRGVTDLAGLARDFPRSPTLDIVEELPGRGMTDFWGISYVAASSELGRMSARECERKLSLLRACWSYFDGVEARVSAELKKGPRGGGRNRAQIVNHIFVNERDWARMVGLGLPEDAQRTAKKRAGHRDAFEQAIREYNAEGKAPRTWPLQFLLRHTAYHVLDHAWEMEDKDLTADS